MKLRDYQEAATTGVFNAWNECTSALAAARATIIPNTPQPAKETDNG